MVQFQWCVCARARVYFQLCVCARVHLHPMNESWYNSLIGVCARTRAHARASIRACVCVCVCEWVCIRVRVCLQKKKCAPKKWHLRLVKAVVALVGRSGCNAVRLQRAYTLFRGKISRGGGEVSDWCDVVGAKRACTLFRENLMCMYVNTYMVWGGFD